SSQNNGRGGENAPGQKQSVEYAGAPPVEPLALLEGRKHQSQSGTQVQEPDKARRSTTLLSSRSRRYPETDTDHHHRRDESGAPEHPVPRKLLAIPPIKRWRDIDCTIDGRGIECEYKG